MLEEFRQLDMIPEGIVEQNKKIGLLEIYNQQADKLQEILDKGIMLGSKKIIRKTMTQLNQLFEKTPKDINRGMANYPLPQRILDIISEGERFLHPDIQEGENEIVPVF